MPADNLTDLRGQIERVTYTNAENNYTVAREFMAARIW